MTPPQDPLRTEAGRRLLDDIGKAQGWSRMGDSESFLVTTQEAHINPTAVLAAIKEIEQQAATLPARQDEPGLRDLRQAIEDELSGAEAEVGEPFYAGAAAAYNYVLSHWPLAAARGEPELDVERLARALRTWENRRHPLPTPDADEGPQDWHAWINEAERLLSAARTPREPKV